MSLPDFVIDAFGQAATAAYAELFQLDALVEDLSSQPGELEAHEERFVATIRLLRPEPGALTLLAPRHVARELARRYLPPDAEQSDELIGDTLAELANVIAGLAKTALKSTPFHFTLSIPSVVSPTGLPSENPPPGDCVVRVSTEVGTTILHLSLSACPETPLPSGEGGGAAAG